MVDIRVKADETLFWVNNENVCMTVEGKSPLGAFQGQIIDFGQYFSSIN